AGTRRPRADVDSRGRAERCPHRTRVLLREVGGRGTGRDGRHCRFRAQPIGPARPATAGGDGRRVVLRLTVRPRPLAAPGEPLAESPARRKLTPHCSARTNERVPPRLAAAVIAKPGRPSHPLPGAPLMTSP